MAAFKEPTDGRLPQLAPAGTRTKLRVGLFADGRTQPRWATRALVEVTHLPIVDVVTAATATRAPAARETSVLWRAYSAVDRRLFFSAPDPSDATDLRCALAGERFSAIPGSRAPPVVIEAWRAWVASLRLDVALELGALGYLNLETLAKHGVWRYCFGEDRNITVSAAAWSEVAQWRPVTHSGLIARLPDGSERMLYASCSRTFPYSVARSRANVLNKAVAFAARALGELHDAGDEWIETRPAVPVQGDRGLPEGPAALRAVSRIGARVARRSLEKLVTVEQWTIAYAFDESESWTNGLEAFTRLQPPKDRIWADPFPLLRDGRHYIFYENCPFESNRGRIEAIEVTPGGVASPPVPVLERDYHLSYPFLIEEDGELFMVPETADNGTVELYRCIDFPHRWELEHVLLRDGRYFDPTLHRDDERWWMFVNVALPGTDGYDELHLYHADRLFGPWQPHARNPVKSDVRSARPAGRLYRQAGALYRPAQVCAPLYGTGVSINRVLRLSPEAYAEREEFRVVAAPTGGTLGLHTINRAGSLQVVDLLVRRQRIGPQRTAFGTEPESLRGFHGLITTRSDN